MDMPDIGNINTSPASLEDAARIAEINISAWKSAYRGIVPDNYLDKLTIDSDLVKRWEKRTSAPQDAVIKATLNNLTIGYVNLCKRLDINHPLDGEVLMAYVDPLHWRKGVGKKLLEYAEDFFREKGYKRVVIWTFEANEPARKFYESSGYILSNERKSFDLEGQKIPEVCYVKAL